MGFAICRLILILPDVVVQNLRQHVCVLLGKSLDVVQLLCFARSALICSQVGRVPAVTEFRDSSVIIMHLPPSRWLQCRLNVYIDGSIRCSYDQAISPRQRYRGLHDTSCRLRCAEDCVGSSVERAYMLLPLSDTSASFAKRILGCTGRPDLILPGQHIVQSTLAHG